MLKKVSIDQVIVGMFIHDLDCSWLNHPFLKNKFKIEDAATIRQIRDAGIRNVVIDTRRGKDVVAVGGEAIVVSAPVVQAAHDLGAEAPIRLSFPSLAEEIGNAKKLHREGNKLVGSIMSDIRLGKQIEVEQCEPLVEGILDSIFRKPDALLPLAQMKTRDEYTFQHSVSVAALAVAFGRVLNMPREVIKEVAMGGLLHDVGKALVPEIVLNKPGKLSDDEFAVMKGHAAHSAALLRDTRGISEIAYQAAAQHHERFDGSGYPEGLKGGQISVYGQMLAIVDVYDAITSLRIYHQGMPATEALRKMFEWSKHHFNPTLVQAFIKGIGIYPAGSLVRLESGRMGVVREVVPDKLLQPVVKVFFHAEKRCYLPEETIDLASSKDRIVAHESFEQWQIDQAKWL